MKGSLNNGWCFHTVKELTSFARRGKSPNYSDNDEGVWVINQECITWDGIDFSKVKFQAAGAEVPTEFYLRVGDVLLNSTGTGTIGRVTVFRGASKPCFADSHVTILRVNRDIIREDFLRYYLSSSQGQRHLEAFCYSGSTNQIELSRKFLLKTVVTSPQPEEQDAILARINLVDSAITATRESIAKAERLQKSLMQQLLTGRLKPDGPPRKAEEFQDTKVGLLPNNWTVARIKDFGEVSTGKTPPTANEVNFGGEFPFVTPGDLGKSKWIRQTDRSLSALGVEHAGLLPANAVCVVCIGATIGKVGLTVGSSCTNQQINTVVCSGGHSPEYLYYAVRHRARHLQVIAGVNATPQLNKTEFSKYRIPMPATIDEEAAIGARLALVDNLIEAKQAKIVALQQLKKSLMQNLLTGRIRLPVETGARKEAAR